MTDPAAHFTNYIGRYSPEDVNEAFATIDFYNEVSQPIRNSLLKNVLRRIAANVRAKYTYEVLRQVEDAVLSQTDINVDLAVNDKTYSGFKFLS